MSDTVKINDSELEGVAGGAGGYAQWAKGSYINYGDHILYTVAAGDVLSGIALRFGVTVAQIQQWNNIPNPDRILQGQKLVIYARILR